MCRNVFIDWVPLHFIICTKHCKALDLITSTCGIILQIPINHIAQSYIKHYWYLLYNALKSFHGSLQISFDTWINWNTIPAAQPTKRTHTHPDHASCALFSCSKQLFCFCFWICRWRMRSRAISLSQSIVWKSSYVPMPGGRSSDVSIKLVDPEITPTV